MKSESRIGSTLMSRRIELGISLEQAARDTNIRARMLEALEAGDYSQYPPRGHAIGMLSSYARYLDLDSAAIVEAFDNEYETFSANREIAQSANNTRRGVGRFGERIAGEKSRPTSRESSRSSRPQRSQRRRGDAEGDSSSKLSRNLKDEALAKDDERYRSGSVRVVGTRQTGSFRSVHPAREDTGRFEPTTRSALTSRSRSGSSRRSGTSTRRSSTVDTFTARPTEDLSRSGEERTPNFFGIDVDTGESTVRSSTRRRSTTRDRASERDDVAQADDGNIIGRLRRLLSSIFSERRTRLIAIAVITIVIAVIIVASVLISTAGHGNSGIIPVQGGATNDTMTTDGENAAHKTITTANGNPVIIKIDVAKGETSLVEVTYDGANAYKGTAVGGQFSREFPVTESFSATFSNPSAVTITENDNPIEIAKNDDGSGSLFISIQSASK